MKITQKSASLWVLVLLIPVGVLALWNSPLADAKPPKGGGKGKPAYTIIPFLPPGFATTASYVSDLNEQGQAVGTVALANGDSRAVHLDIATNLYTSLTDNSRAEGVNNLNQIVGTEYDAGGHRALFWSSPSAATVVLSALPGDVKSSAWGSNDAGIVVGASWTPRSAPPEEEQFATGVVWRVVVEQDGQVQVDGPVALSPLANGSDSFGVDVNEVSDGSCLVTGETWFGGNLVREAVVWNVSLNANGTLAAPGSAIGLGTLGEQNPSGSFAIAINNLGDICGESDGLPTLAPAGEAVGPLPLPRSTLWGRAEDVNDPGDTVGQLRIGRSKRDSIGAYHAYLWRGTEKIDLETQIAGDSGWDALWSANVVNNAGVIAGWGRLDVENRGFLLVPNQP